MLQWLSLDSFMRNNSDQSAALAALIAVIEKTIPLVLLTHRNMACKLRFLQSVEAGRSFLLLTSIRLRAVIHIITW